MQSEEEKLVDSFEFLLPSLVAMKSKYTNHQLVYSAIQTVIFSISTLCYVLSNKK